jgi:hypothetical protein
MTHVLVITLYYRFLCLCTRVIFRTSTLTRRTQFDEIIVRFKFWDGKYSLSENYFSSSMISITIFTLNSLNIYNPRCTHTLTLGHLALNWFVKLITLNTIVQKLTKIKSMKLLCFSSLHLFLTIKPT